MKVALLHLFGSTRAQLAAHLRDGGLDVHAVSNAEDLLTLIASGAAGVVVTDLRLPGVHEGMELLSQCHAMDPQLTVIALSDQEDTATAVEAVHRGARDVLAPDRLPRLATACRQAIRSRELTLQTRAAESLHDGELAPVRRGIVPIHEVLRGNHPAVGKLRQALLRLSRVDTDVLVKAETGCGKEVVARCLHDYGPRADKRFVAINCGAIPENIFESELFGHEAGAFTGATKRRIGKLEYAAGGTVFLDEIESMPMAMQVKLLRALQQRTIERVGGNEPIRLSCRVVAATKDDLLELSRAGRFRIDLYYRINVIELSLPPLRERRDDIPLLAHAFALEAAEHHGLSDADLDIEFVCRLMVRDWPGNVRELRNAVERHVLGMPELAGGDDAPQQSLPQLVASFERTVIEQCLRMCGGSVTRACEILHVPRKTLYDKLTRFSVDPQDYRGDGPAASGFMPMTQSDFAAV
ncbi:sigma-54 dependent transcriptional regulator [Rhizobacter sp. OV335]|uniref:sigma-54-dependent transcriptional regulator n=1 Tax=Rhizobacter sp. OV335 TaxID=1500264 RepID=UPI000913FCE0|nr:sigma-54 dependent transcriptional regulator [Rhizobacter sp. OV335]SHN38387.1 two-component system, NtrC family, C4-dicarboxylate transport response regulator DctD [Rhizobacter sp. OV335]